MLSKLVSEHDCHAQIPIQKADLKHCKTFTSELLSSNVIECSFAFNKGTVSQKPRKEFFCSQPTKSQNKQHSSPFTNPWLKVCLSVSFIEVSNFVFSPNPLNIPSFRSFFVDHLGIYICNLKNPDFISGYYRGI